MELLPQRVSSTVIIAVRRFGEEHCTVLNFFSHWTCVLGRTIMHILRLIMPHTLLTSEAIQHDIACITSGFTLTVLGSSYQSLLDIMLRYVDETFQLDPVVVRSSESLSIYVS